ncbi:dehydrogenase/reductase SDR family member 7 [Suncus etruscus]|uniref:dehydrogenase/reductase SDR family member 7 n=1 Tax=Suncus etruscus TaxID=109475 RepID=UPI002110A098|nr:dehydrogenase/reductase SDR family member 7 [Suncus etruscus]
MSWALALGALLLLLLLLLFVRAEGDLRLLWAERWGRRPEWELTSQVVWITGASSGIGEELAYQLSKLCVCLVLSARRLDELERVKNKCLETSHLKEKDILVLPLDLADRNSHAAATKAVLQKFGKIDILVNNGGKSQRSLVVDASLDVYKELIEINYLGTVSLTKCVLPHMIEKKQGKIVTVNSLMGFMAAPLSSGYCGSKHALQGFCDALRTELVSYPGILVSTIYPGPVQSNIVKESFTEEVTKIVGNPGDQSYKMATSRCVRLMLVSMANDLKEVWISDHPYLLLAYMWQYMPTLARWITGKLGKKRIQNFKSGVDADSSYCKIWKTKCE